MLKNLENNKQYSHWKNTHNWKVMKFRNVYFKFPNFQNSKSLLPYVNGV